MLSMIVQMRVLATLMEYVLAIQISIFLIVQKVFLKISQSTS